MRNDVIETDEVQLCYNSHEVARCPIVSVWLWVRRNIAVIIISAISKANEDTNCPYND